MLHNRKWWIPCCSFPPLMALCALSAAFLIFAATTPPTPPTHTAEPPHPVSDMILMGSTTEKDGSIIQILGRRFDDTEIAAGREVYLQVCAACHGVDAQGQFPDAPLEPDVTGRIGAPPHSETGHTWHHSDILLIRYVTEGGFSDLTRFYLMPPFGAVLSDEQILYVLAYIKTLWTDEQRVRQWVLTEQEQALFE